MRVPSVLNKNCLLTYKPEKNFVKRWQKLKIKSFDIENWDDKIPKSLQELCVECIAKNWRENPILDDIVLLEDRYLLLDLLPEDLPLDLTIPKINDEVYWKKCYVKRWPKKLPNIKDEIEINQIVKNGVNNLNENFLNTVLAAKEKESIHNAENTSRIVSKASSRRSSKKSSIILSRHGNKNTEKRTWKKCFIEMHVKEYLENLKPENYEPEKIKDLCDLCGSSVEILQIDQMLCSENSSNKIPLNAILTGFPNLKELCLCFKQTYAEDDFSWNIVNVSYQDIKLFAKGLEIRLQTLRITNSDVDCEKAIIILKALLKHELEILDFSHCKIGNRGMMAISKFILENPVKEVLLGNNRIGPNGVSSLAYAVTQETCNVKILDLKLNNLLDEGGNLLIKCIGKLNKTIKSLSLSGCGFSKNFELAEIIKVNKCLETFDISNNNLGEAMGEKILRGITFNTSLKKLDLRMCRVASATESEIQNEVYKNRKGLKKHAVYEERKDEAEGETLWPEQMITELQDILIIDSQDHVRIPPQLIEDNSP